MHANLNMLGGQHRLRDHGDRADLGFGGGIREDGGHHIVGFAGFQLTGCSGGKNIERVWESMSA